MTEDIGDAVVIDEEIAERINPSQAEATNEGRKLAGEDHPEEPPRRRRTSARDPFPNDDEKNNYFPCPVASCSTVYPNRAFRSYHMRQDHPGYKYKSGHFIYEEDNTLKLKSSNIPKKQYSCYVKGCLWKGNCRKRRSVHMKKQHLDFKKDLYYPKITEKKEDQIENKNKNDDDLEKCRVEESGHFIYEEDNILNVEIATEIDHKTPVMPKEDNSDFSEDQIEENYVQQTIDSNKQMVEIMKGVDDSLETWKGNANILEMFRTGYSSILASIQDYFEDLLQQNEELEHRKM